MSGKYDVVLYEIETGVIDAVVGKNMPLDAGPYSAECFLRYAVTQLIRQPGFDARIVPGGKYRKDDKIPGEKP